MEQSERISAVRAALEREPEVNVHDNPIQVVATEPKTIKLVGDVDNIAVKRRALQVARRAADGHDVVDRLTLKVQTSRAGAELRQAVQAALASEPVFQGFPVLDHGTHQPPKDRGDWLAVEVDDQRVILHGEVWSLAHRRLAEVLAWWVPGTADVENRIHVQPPEDDADTEITDIIRMVLDRDPTLKTGEINVSTQDRQVRLEGYVRSDVGRRMASYDCWYIPGVHAVHNHLEVRNGPR